MQYATQQLVFFQRVPLIYLLDKTCMSTKGDIKNVLRDVLKCKQQGTKSQVDGR